MRYFMKFLAAVIVVFSLTAIASDALSDHTPDTRDIWLVTVDFDVFGNPSIAPGFEPRPYTTIQECASVGDKIVAMINYYQPARRFVMVCIIPDDIDNVTKLIDQVIEDIRPLFTPPQAGA